MVIFNISCATVDESGLLAEDDLLVTRKYVGNFVDYGFTGPGDFGWPNTIWIKTTQDSVYGKISAYSHKCDFVNGEKLYIRKAYQIPGINSYWIYQIENDKSDKVWYKLSEFQDGNRVLAHAFR